ncbi:formylglycine-generating enzyme family protein [Gordonia neofelifaecis]|nr:formylglycine-generating enzyme family protein [Gordonia neofelifaecis]
MVRVPAGEFTMGSDDFFPEERPAHAREVGAFWIDRHPVTVAEFRRFVQATGYVTVAERDPDPARYPDALPGELRAGGLVFVRPPRQVPLDDWRRWWAYVPGAQWRRPFGPDSDVRARDRHPVTQVGIDDARAYAEWAGKALPTEAEWEYAAASGRGDTTYAWGDEFAPRGRRMANTWMGAFPSEFVPGRGQSEVPGTTPVGTYPPNAFDLVDMTGNVWEWTEDRYSDSHRRSTCCPPTRTGDGGEDHYVVKGGSFLCAPNYCLRYRPAARQSQDSDTSSCHIGFRCVIRD